ncbi:MAG: endonuclease III [Candidatus Micrarchaeia archaeon]
MKRAKALRVLARLDKEYGEPSLGKGDAFHLLVATILSAQCTDARVDKVMPALFARFKTPADFSRANASELEKLVRSTGYYRQKARHLKGAAKAIVEKHGGLVPRSMSELVALPGVGRKTANIVLSLAFQRVEGVAVDTHVWRLSRRLGFTLRNTQAGIERDLMALFPRGKWWALNELLVEHGRRVCVARKPRCGKCVVRALCPSRESN